MERTRPGARTRTTLLAVATDGERSRSDWLATEEPLEIRLAAGGRAQRAAVTMRTPGADFALAAGFLYGEGIVRSRRDIRAIRYCVDVPDEQQHNVVTVDLDAPVLPDLDALERHFTMTSACGVCGKATLDGLEQRGLQAVASDLCVSPDVLATLPGRLRDAQQVFDRTGGLHAAALFDRDGTPVAVREDVGRHNALDKLIGWALLDGRLPLADGIVLVSGRASFELVQKAVAAGVPCLAAISAPSSLAVDVARRFGLTLVGFLRGERFNVYTQPARLAASRAEAAG